MQHMCITQTFPHTQNEWVRLVEFKSISAQAEEVFGMFSGII